MCNFWDCTIFLLPLVLGVNAQLPRFGVSPKSGGGQGYGHESHAKKRALRSKRSQAPAVPHNQQHHVSQQATVEPDQLDDAKHSLTPDQCKKKLYNEPKKHFRWSFLDEMAEAHFQARVASMRPDPRCRTGLLSLKLPKGGQVCVPTYCDEASDYGSCASKRGQDSEKACCVSKVMEMSCLVNPQAYCVKECSETLPPCIIPAGEEFKIPTVTSAAEDCLNVVPEWKQMMAAAIGDLDKDGEFNGLREWSGWEKARKTLMATFVLEKAISQPELEIHKVDVAIVAALDAGVSSAADIVQRASAIVVQLKYAADRLEAEEDTGTPSTIRAAIALAKLVKLPTHVQAAKDLEKVQNDAQANLINVLSNREPAYDVLEKAWIQGLNSRLKTGEVEQAKEAMNREKDALRAVRDMNDKVKDSDKLKGKLANADLQVLLAKQASNQAQCELDDAEVRLEEAKGLLEDAKAGELDDVGVAKLAAIRLSSFLQTGNATNLDENSPPNTTLHLHQLAKDAALFSSHTRHDAPEQLVSTVNPAKVANAENAIGDLEREVRFKLKAIGDYRQKIEDVMGAPGLARDEINQTAEIKLEAQRNVIEVKVRVVRVRATLKFDQVSELAKKTQVQADAAATYAEQVQDLRSDLEEAQLRLYSKQKELGRIKGKLQMSNKGSEAFMFHKQCDEVRHRLNMSDNDFAGSRNTVAKFQADIWNMTNRTADLMAERIALLEEQTAAINRVNETRTSLVGLTEEYAILLQGAAQNLARCEVMRAKIERRKEYLASVKVEEKKMNVSKQELEAAEDGQTSLESLMDSLREAAKDTREGSKAVEYASTAYVKRRKAENRASINLRKANMELGLLANETLAVETEIARFRAESAGVCAEPVLLQEKEKAVADMHAEFHDRLLDTANLTNQVEMRAREIADLDASVAEIRSLHLAGALDNGIMYAEQSGFLSVEAHVCGISTEEMEAYLKEVREELPPMRVELKAEVKQCKVDVSTVMEELARIEVESEDASCLMAARREETEQVATSITTLQDELPSLLKLFADDVKVPYWN